MRLWTGFVGSVVEAWAELRVHRTRVLLSLIGVGVAVAALTTVVAGGAIATQITVEQNERYGGRPANVQLNAYNPETGASPGTGAMSDAVAAAAARYGVTHTTRNGNGMLRVQLPDGVVDVSSSFVDVAYGAIHRTSLVEGAWFTDYDVERLAPAIIVSSDLWNRIGAPDLRTHPTVEIVAAERNVTAVVTGVTASSPASDGQDLSGFMLNDAYLAFANTEELANSYFSYELWVPPDIAAELMPLLQADVAGSLGEGWQVDAYRSDYLGWGGEDPLLPLKLAVGAFAILVLPLGALGLVNIALVTVRQRIREIGIRRSFGATAGRVFFAVMMESVVATVFAGAIGVLVSVLLIKNPLTSGWIGDYVQDVPAFPVDAALIGLGAATLVGALAGLLPALVAVRVKVIDAIRY